MFRIGSGWSGEMLEQPQTRGFLWGVGTAMAAYFLWPAMKEAVRPATKGVVRGAMAAGDRFRYAMANAREGLEDIMAEAQFERMRDAMEEQVADADDPLVDPLPPTKSDPREH